MRRNQAILLIAQSVVLITYAILMLSGWYTLALYVLGFLALMHIIPIIHIRREIHRLDQELIEILTNIERRYQYNELSLGKPLNMEKELQGLREDIERHLAKDDS